MTDRQNLDESLAQALRDLEELDHQVAEGEIDHETASRLRATYEAELVHAKAAIEAAGPPAEPPVSPAPRSRRTVGAAILIAGLVGAVTLAASVSTSSPDDRLEGVAGGDVDLDSVSNETMEAVLASAREDPAVADQIPYMEFRLAERYFEEGEYSKAFEHYGAIIENNPPQDLFVQSMTRVGWLVWSLNNETDLALRTLDRALEVEPDNPLTLYVKGQVLWCGAGRTAEAAAIFDKVLAGDGLDPAVVEQVETDRDLAAAGGACSG